MVFSASIPLLPAENRGVSPMRLFPHGEPVVRRFLDAIHDGKVHFDELGVTDLDILFPPVVSFALGVQQAMVHEISSEITQVEARQCIVPSRGVLSSADKGPLVERLVQKDASPKLRDGMGTYSYF